MSKRMDRRGFVKRSVAYSVGAAMAASFEERALLAHAEEEKKKDAAPPTAPAEAFPMGKVGEMQISRLICGGNLISGYAHSRDLMYVSPLLKHYFTDEKVFETLKLCEANGINAAMLKLDADTLRIVNAYWSREHGRIQWIAQIVSPETMQEDIMQALDNGAAGVFTTGQMGDALVRAGQVAKLAKAVETIKAHGAVAGVGCHELEVVEACEKAGVATDFYMKTFHHHKYWSADIPDRHDNLFDESPDKTIATMRDVAKPWVAFKVLAAGAIDPRDGFEFAVKNGADFLCVGMFDFQVREDAEAARKVFAAHADRARPWRA